jgi:hypothetical protein
MANRIYRVWIRNSGTGDIQLLDKSLAHGEWIEGWEPSETAASIKPGEERRFESAEGGDVPILGSVMTGNEGSVLFSTFASPSCSLSALVRQN